MKRITSEWLKDPKAQAVCTVLNSAGYQAYFVGGCVRNDLLGAAISDIDLATDARPQMVMELAEKAGLHAVPTGVEHGTVTIVSDGLVCEVTTFRKDIETDGRRAVVHFSEAIEDDAKRRDFTMNALYANAAGEVLDPLNGLPDLIKRRVRFIENADERIREDYLRILRFFRFHAWYGDPDAGLDAEGLAAVAANQAGLETLSRERIGHEMLKLLAAPDPAPAMASMQQVGVLAHILPGTNASALPLLVHIEGQTDMRPDAVRRLASLGNVTGFGKSLRLSRKDTRRVEALVRAVESTATASELAYRNDADFARDVMVLRAVLFETHLPQDLEQELIFGAEAVFPIKAKDLAGEYEGVALGNRLKELEARWIASGFSLSRKELLT